MPCDHLGGPDIIELAERDLRARGAAPADGMRFRHGENVDGMWTSIVIEIERRGGQWVVARLDRGQERLPESETGLREIR